jgi:hypothetical protein
MLKGRFHKVHLTRAKAVMMSDVKLSLLMAQPVPMADPPGSAPGAAAYRRPSRAISVIRS